MVNLLGRALVGGDDLFKDLSTPNPSSSSDPADPFVGTVKQTNRLLADCRILVAGVDVTAKIHPHLVNVHVIDSVTGQECHIELDDRDGRLPIPAWGDPVEVLLGWVNEDVYHVFLGWISEVEHGFGRQQGGRRMWIHATGHNALATNIKTKFNQSEGDGAPPGQQEGTKVPFGTFFNKVMSAGGGVAKIHPEFFNKQSDYWAQVNESALNVGQRFATENGGIFRIVNGNEGEMSKYGEKPDGSPGGTVICKWGENLIGYRIHIHAGRPVWGKAAQSYFDHAASEWKDVNKNMKLFGAWGKAQSKFQQSGPAANEGDSNRQNDGAQSNTETQLGEGRIVINGEPTARMWGKAEIVGVRDGVDGSYFLTGVEHIYSRQGFITWLDVTIDAKAAAGKNVGSSYDGGTNT